MTTPKLFWEYYPYSKYICEVGEPIIRDAIDGFFIAGLTYQGKDILLSSKYEVVHSPEMARRLMEAREKAYKSVRQQIEVFKQQGLLVGKNITETIKPKDRNLFLPSTDQIFKYFNIPLDRKEFYKFYTRTPW